MDLILTVEQLTSCLSLCVWWWDLGRPANLHVFCGLGENLKPCSLVNPVGGSTWVWDMEAIVNTLDTKSNQFSTDDSAKVFLCLWSHDSVVMKRLLILRTSELRICSWQMSCFFFVGFIMHSGITVSKHWSGLNPNLKWSCGQSNHPSSILSYNPEPFLFEAREDKTPAHHSADKDIQKTTRAHIDFQAI